MLRKRYLKKTMNVLYILIGVCIHTGSCQIDLFSFKTTLNHRSPDDNYIIVVVKSIIDCVRACIVHVQCRCADSRKSAHLHWTCTMQVRWLPGVTLPFAYFCACVWCWYLSNGERMETYKWVKDDVDK